MLREARATQVIKLSLIKVLHLNAEYAAPLQLHLPGAMMHSMWGCFCLVTATLRCWMCRIAMLHSSSCSGKQKQCMAFSAMHCFACQERARGPFRDTTIVVGDEGRSCKQLQGFSHILHSSAVWQRCLNSMSSLTRLGVELACHLWFKPPARLCSFGCHLPTISNSS